MLTPSFCTVLPGNLLQFADQQHGPVLVHVEISDTQNGLSYLPLRGGLLSRFL